MSQFSTFLTTEIDLIEGLIEQRDFSQALERTSGLIADGTTMPGENAHSKLLFLQSRCLFHLGSYVRATAKLLEAEAGVRLGNDHVLYAAIRQLQGMINHLQGDLDSAIEDYLDASASWKRSQAWEKLYGCMVNIGMAHFQKGDLIAARERVEKALQLSLQYNSSEQSDLCRFNLARVMIFRGDFSEAGSLVLSTGAKSRDSYMVLRRSELRGLLHVLCMRTTQARERLKAALQLAEQRKAARDVAVCLEYLGLNEYFAGNYAKAKEYYQQVLEMPEPTASAVAQTKRMLTDAYIAEGAWELAKKIAAEAETAITKINERIELGALWRAYGQIAAHDCPKIGLVSDDSVGYLQAA